MMWLLFAFLSALFAGLTAILAKCGIENMDSNVATAIRTIVVLIFSWVLVFVMGVQNGIFHLSGKTITFLVLSGVVTGASWLCYFHALQIGDVNRVTPIDKSSTILTMILAFLFFGETVGAVQICAMVLMGAGTYLMIQKKEAETGKKTKKTWLLYALLSAVFASLTSILAKVGMCANHPVPVKKVGMQDVDSNLGTAIRTAVVLVMAWVVVFATGKQKTIHGIGKKNGVFLVLSGVATGASWLCYFRALQTGPASVVVPIDKLSILVTIFFSYFVFGEKLTKKSGAGLVLLVAGTLLLLKK